MNKEDFTRCLNLTDTQRFESDVGTKPEVFRWFVSAKTRSSLADRSIDSNIKKAWSEPLLATNSPGHFIVPAVVQGFERWIHAAKTFLLPLKWKRGGHSGRIPTPIITIGDQVSALIRLSPKLNEQLANTDKSHHLSEAWGLDWSCKSLRELDLSDLQITPESAWAGLTVGLASAILDTVLNPQLICTGAWEVNEGKWKVAADTLITKLDTTYESGLRIFGVPNSSVSDVLAHFRLSDRTDAKVAGLLDEPSDLYSAVLAALLQAGQEPTATADRKIRVDWYHTRLTNKEADEFYRKSLLEDVADGRRQELQKTELRAWRPDILISIVSTSDLLINLATLVFNPKQLQLIYTKNADGDDLMEGRFEKIKNWINEKNATKQSTEPNVEILSPIAVADDFSELRRFVDLVKNSFRQDQKPSLLIDATPGKRAMQMSMLQGAQAGDRILCWWHDTHIHTRRPVPFSEKMLLWECTTDGLLRPIL